jgi:exodeoxyribonuclease-5
VNFAHWIANPTENNRILTLGGLAGTGKTLLVKHTVAYLEALTLPHAASALTGKATSVLRKKGINYATTLHAAMYRVDEKTFKLTGKLKFIKNEYLAPRIMVIDEASMLPKYALDDLLSFRHIRILAVGDHGQLKPIGEDPAIMENPDIQLDVPHRHALTSNILKLSYYIRQNGTPPKGQCPGVLVAPFHEFWDHINDPTISQIIVGFNKTRHVVNKEIRRLRGYYGGCPDPGEKIIFLNNNHNLGLYNGQILEVVTATVKGDDYVLDLIDPDTQQKWSGVHTWSEQYGKNRVDWNIRPRINYDLMLADYAYAVTCNNAQGSEWDKGLVLQETHPDWDIKRWGYTGATRFISDIRYFC